MALLRIDSISKSFGGVTAIADLSFDVPEGKVYAVIGPNGAGKTTLFNMLCGIYTPDEGSIRFRESEIVTLPPHQVAALGVSRTFQNLQMFFNMSVLDNVKVGAHLRSRTPLWSAALRLPQTRHEERQADNWAREALSFCGLEEYLRSEADALPYGVLKRVEIARALAAAPKLLLMDEPAAGLNDTETKEMRALIRRISESGITVLLVEHNMGLVMDVSDRILVIDYGSRLAEGTPKQIQNDPAVIQAYLGGEVQYAI
ncbi:MAG: ABC transporter ATP-binding protein [Gammaproteobacteria bacterium]|nr:ABC transporter ATP-binding protein [Gammaproteobacteria bacterium]